MPPHLFFLPLAVLGAALVSVAMVMTLRDTAAKRRLVPVSIVSAAIALPALLFSLPTAASGARLATIFGILLATVVIGALSLARFCDACSQVILPRGLQHVRECPRCGDDLRAQNSARAAGIHRDPIRRGRA